MFLLHWEVYALMELAVNLWNEDLHWFNGRRSFIYCGVHMGFNGDVGSRVIGFAFSYGHQMFLLVSRVSKDSRGKELVRTMVPTIENTIEKICIYIYIYIHT